MRDPQRIDKVLQELKKVWEQCPDLRLGQLICNVVQDPALYYVEDYELVDALKQFYKVEDQPNENVKTNYR